jgi:hypothetical protein
MLSGYAYPNDSRDGNYWAELNKYAKMGYVFGLIDGIFAGRYFGIKTSDSCDKGYLSEMHKYFEGIMPKDVFTGIDSFYSDYTNRNIEIFNAFYIVLMKIGGESDNLIDSLIRDLRKEKIPKQDELGLKP